MGCSYMLFFGSSGGLRSERISLEPHPLSIMWLTDSLVPGRHVEKSMSGMFRSPIMRQFKLL